MKIYISLIFCLLIQFSACSQVNPPDNTTSSRQDCKTTDISFGDYPEIYKSLNEDSWDSIKRTFSLILETKDIQEYRNSQERWHNWFILMRMHDIKWQTKKKIVLKELDNVFNEVILGHGYLSEKNRNMLTNNKGCPYSISDPINLPQTFVWLIINIDTDYGASFLDKNWDILMIDDSYMNRLRYVLLNQLREYFKVPSIQLLLDKLYSKYSITKHYEKEINIIQELREKNMILKTKNQLTIWQEFIEKNKSTFDEPMSSKSVEIWSKNIQFITDVFEDIDIEIPLGMAEQSNDLGNKYCLTYCCCNLLNRKYPKRADDKLIQRIDKLIIVIQNNYPTLKIGEKDENNFLNKTYQTLKKWHQ